MTDTDLIAELTIHRDHLGAQIQRLSDFLDARSLNSWKHGACWAAEDAIKTLTERADDWRDAANALEQENATLTDRLEALTQELALCRDTLRLRSNALNATGTHNDKLRATLTRISTELMALEPRAKDFATRSSLLMLSRFADHALLEALADKEPTP